jgi:hypothetical protein
MTVKDKNKLVDCIHVLTGTFVDELIIIILVLAVAFGLSTGQMLVILEITLKFFAVFAVIWLTYSFFVLGSSDDDEDEEGWWAKKRQNDQDQGGVEHVN